MFLAKAEVRLLSGPCQSETFRAWRLLRALFRQSLAARIWAVPQLKRVAERGHNNSRSNSLLPRARLPRASVLRCFELLAARCGGY
jgi:pyruvate dehydrogenase complex dehydrogenase (E1) component